MARSAETRSELFDRRLQAALALKDFAVAQNLDFDQKICEALNQLDSGAKSPPDVKQLNQLDAVINQLTSITYPTGIDTVGVSKDPELISSFRQYRRWLSVVGIFLLVIGGFAFYQCRILAVGGTLTSRLSESQTLQKQIEQAHQDASEATSEASRLAQQLGLPANGDCDPATPKDVDQDAAQHPSPEELKSLIARNKQQRDTIQARVDALQSRQESLQRQIAWSEVWPAIFAGTLGTLGACAYLIYAIIGAYANRRMTMTALYSELMRLPIGAIIGWILYLAFCRQHFHESFMMNDKSAVKEDVTNEAILLLPFLAGYSSTLVVEILNRLIDAIRTSLGMKNTAAPPQSSAAGK